MKYTPSTPAGQSKKNKTGSWRTYRPVFLHEKCVGCGICQKVCPEGVVYATGKANKTGKIYRECDLEYCKGCGLCAKNCPFAAITMEMEIK
ncbi:MAG: 4Fe-4S binding protein [Patescibacteria group bacterium]|jgi:pyruvate ferredoxin oxidoreductase delta subunit